MTYFKPMDAICRKCRNDKRRRIYRVRHEIGESKNRVTLLCDHSKPHYTPRGVVNAHVTELLQQVKKHPTFPVRCVNCGRTIQAQGWDRPRDGEARSTIDLVDTYFSGRNPIPKNFVCSRACFQETLAAQARRRRDAWPETRCEFCGESFTARRGAKYCSTRCRVAGHRAKSADKT